MLGWGKKRKEQERAKAEELAKIEEGLRVLMMREPTRGPNARPWKERRTTAPDGYPPQRWGDRWDFDEPTEDGLIGIYEDCVGAIFPGDTVEINGRTWVVASILTDHDWPVAEVRPAN